MRRRTRSTDQKTVALLVETSRAYGRGICRGVARFAEQNPDWLILYQERNLKESIPESLRKYKVDGILMRVDQPGVARKIVSLGIPTVDLLGARVEGDCPAFLPDDYRFQTMWRCWESITTKSSRNYAIRG
jgi:LacI family transcriptional regulator